MEKVMRLGEPHEKSFEVLYKAFPVTGQDHRTVNSKVLHPHLIKSTFKRLVYIMWT